MNIKIRSIINIFTILDGEINILLKNNEYIIVDCFDNLEKINDEYIANNLKITNLNLKQCHTFSCKDEDEFKIDVLYIGVVNANDIKLDNNFIFVPISSCNIKESFLNIGLEYLKKELSIYGNIKKIYNNEFSLPEIQKIFEFILEKKIDRRNFRKKLIKMDIIESLEKIDYNKKGRPAKLYKLKSKDDDFILI
ncbi:MAG: hypothetical protein Q4E75_01420 [bacterium]|nr:hypothetical protein [bacterium]